MAGLSSASLFQTLTAVKSKIDSCLEEFFNQDGAVSLSKTAEEKGREVLLRLEKTLDDLSELHRVNKVNVFAYRWSFIGLLT